jgi:outer membrane protein OmpA-like peptidoglycan-associated protein
MRRYFLSCWLLLAAASSLSLRAQQMDFELGIVAYYPFNGNALDKTGQGGDGIVSGAQLTEDRFGNAQAAYSFDGQNQSIRIPHNAQNDFSQRKTFTVSLWIQPRDLNPGCILLKGYDYGLKWEGMQSSLTLYSGAMGGYPRGTRASWSSSRWHHIALVQEEKRLLLYIDGELDAQKELAHTLQVRQEDLFLGKHPYFWGAFAGKIDDLLIYDRALNAYEVQALGQMQEVPASFTPRKPLPDLKPELLAGVWQGVLLQPANKEVSSYAFTMKIQPQGESIRGFSRIEVQSSDAYGVTELEGSLSGGFLTFRDGKITSQKNYKDFNWCRKNGRLYLDPSDNSLRGEWYADNCQKGGSILLYKTQSAFNFFGNRLSEYISLDELRTRLQASQQAAKPVSNTGSDETVVAILALSPISFNYDKATITSASQQYLRDVLAKFLKESPRVKVNITGHTDNQGNPSYNVELSRRRAKAVADFLASCGVDARRLSYEGFGSSRPLVPNTSPEGRQKNRRVEFEVSY